MLSPERCQFCGARAVDPHRWTCPLNDEDAEDWAEDDIDERDEEDDIDFDDEEEVADEPR
jgi:hypothetical protein